jgi:hypothetical protein
VQIVLKSGSLNLLEPSGPVQACTGIALSFSDSGQEKKSASGEYISRYIVIRILNTPFEKYSCKWSKPADFTFAFSSAYILFNKNCNVKFPSRPQTFLLNSFLFIIYDHP